MTPEEIKAWREARGLTQEALAQRLDVDVMTISRWERGDRTPPPYLYLALREIARQLKSRKKSGGAR